jgi:hypothetical protein
MRSGHHRNGSSRAIEASEPGDASSVICPKTFRVRNLVVPRLFPHTTHAAKRLRTHDILSRPRPYGNVPSSTIFRVIQLAHFMLS